MVNAKRNVMVLGIALMAGFGSTVKSAEFFTDQGSIWAGGSFCYLSEYNRNSKNPANIVMLSPMIRFFPVKYFLLSPAFSWENMSQDGDNTSYSSGTFAIGPELGFAYGNNIPVIPYIISGIKYAHSYSSSTYPGTISQTSTTGADGYRIPLYTGIMIPFMDGLGIQVETGFVYNHLRDYTDATSSDMSVFSISVGVCGVSKKMAISILSSVTDLFF